MLLERKTLVAAALTMGMGWMSLFGIGSAIASVVTLTDKNSTADFETEAGQGHPVGQFNWTVDTVDVLAQQWFWFRYGSTGPATSLEQLGNATASAQNRDFDLGNDYLKMSFQDDTLKVEVIYTLVGGLNGSGRSGINEVINITAKQTLSDSLNFFQYVDFNLSQDRQTPDTLLITGGNTARQSAGPDTLEETAATPAPTYFQADVGSNILDLFASPGLWNLNDVVGPVVGDVNWAFQWDFGVLNAGDTRQISKTKYVELIPPGNDVPEPATIALFAAGGLLILGRKR